MRWSQNKKNRVKVEFSSVNHQKRGASVPNHRAQSGRPAKRHNGIWLLFAGLNRWLIAGKYQSHRVQRTWLTKSNILWLKIGIAGFAILMVFRNDFQFTINLSGNNLERVESENTKVDQMGVVHTVALKSKTTPAKRERIFNKKKVETSFKAKNVTQYISHYTDMAQEEMQRFGIPASLTMAQAILASEAGRSSSTANYNNHFGRHLKGINFEDDKTNWRAHSLYVIENYPQLLKAGDTYMDWVKALDHTDYSFDEAYSKQLLTVIKDYKLYQLDY